MAGMVKPYMEHEWLAQDRESMNLQVRRFARHYQCGRLMNEAQFDGLLDALAHLGEGLWLRRYGPLMPDVMRAALSLWAVGFDLGYSFARRVSHLNDAGEN